MTTPSVDTFAFGRDRWSDLGASPEDPEPGADEGASGTQAASDQSARSLAARVDSALAAEDANGEGGEAAADVELLSLGDQLLRQLGIHDGVTLQLNTLGDAETRDAWRAARRSWGCRRCARTPSVRAETEGS
jgi:hypothetical protein